MPRGFAGRHAVAYLGQVSEAHTEAIGVGRQQVPDETLRSPRERQLPFGPEDATVGSFTTGRGNSTNIVASQSEYESVSRLVSQADEKMGECLYGIAMEVESLCQTSFILPEAVPGCLNISDSIKRSLGEFRSLTEDALIQTRNFAGDISNIG